MKWIHKITYIIFMISCSFTIAQSEIHVENLECEMLTNPLGIDVRNPNLSWQIQTEEKSIVQEAYQILAASSPDKLTETDADLWNSEKVFSNESVNVQYSGKKLTDKDEVYWRVKVWTNKGATNWSETAFWSMGILTYANWRSTRWIGHDGTFNGDSITKFSKLPARYLRKQFQTTKSIKKATVYLMGLGMYELYMNGQKIGDQVLAPIPTDYTQNVKYNVFNVTQQLQNGENTIGVVLGNGRYFTMRHYKAYKVKNFGFPKMAMQLNITYVDGTSEIIKSDESWKITANGPIRSNNEYDGEIYDARKEIPHWNINDFNDADWINATYVQPPGGFYEAQLTPNMTIKEIVNPKSITKNGNNYVLDMGQNMAGWLQIKVRGNKGDSIQLRFAESLQKDGSLYRENLRDAMATDVYILKGSEEEIWEPSFVYHGFRFVEISGLTNTPKKEDFIGKQIYDDIKTTGSFESSNQTLNQIFQNAYWGIRDNYKGMPIDCPQRNERQPWLGDRTTGAYGESFLFDNETLYVKWLDDIAYAQTEDGGIPDVAPAFWNYYGDDVTWPGTFITVANMLHQQFGNKTVVKKHYAAMKKWITYMEINYLKEGLMTKDRYGDWCVPPESLELIHATDPELITDGTLIATSFYYYLLGIMTDFSTIAKAPASDVAYYNSLRSELKNALNKAYFNPENNTYDNNTVTANLLPLRFGMVPDGKEAAVFKNIEEVIEHKFNSHISTGVIGTQFLMRTLADFGRSDLSYTLASNVTYPSWGYMAENGATTIWELWNGNTADPKMNSQNHVMLLGDLMIWYYEHLAGIQSDRNDPGFKTILMKPDFSVPLTFVNASYQSTYGNIVSHWKKTKKTLLWNLQIPANSHAKVTLPTNQMDAVKINGEKLTKTNVQYQVMEGSITLEIPSGNYDIEMKGRFL